MTSIGDDRLVAAVRGGENVVLATAGGSALHNLVSAYAESLGEHRTSASVIVLRIDARPATTSGSREVRLFGRPYEMTDTTALVAAALGATIFPTFAQPGPSGHCQIQVNAPCRVRNTSEIALQRTAQRLAWELERFALSVPAYESMLRAEVDRPRLERHV